MQNPPPHAQRDVAEPWPGDGTARRFRAGDVVQVRGEAWRVESVSRGEDCTALALMALSGDRRRGARTVLLPFDRPGVSDVPGRLWIGSRRQWCARLRASVIETAADGLARCLRGAAIDWHPYQLEPALVLAAGHSHRVLLADHVGLGKTIEAGVAIVVLRGLSLAGRVLCLVPAGLRSQWQLELRQHFGLEALDCDGAWVERRVREMPVGANPWTLPGVYLVSHDYVKRAEVLPGLDTATWDLIVVDEAHSAASRSDRAEAIGGLARRAMRVLLLSATPHDGDDARFERLCAIGRLGDDDPLAVFRRTRRELGLADAHRTCVLAVAQSAHERHVHDLLGRYRRVVTRETGEAARLAMLVLQKRALSGPYALWRSLSRRLELLLAGPAKAEQLVLPLVEAGSDDVDDLPDSALSVPGLSSLARERAWLGALSHAARAAVPHDRKLAALERFVRRAREPLVVFTEYRDTLAHVARRLTPVAALAVLHGAQGPDERAASLEAFERRRVRVLLATDVAAQGLNLQHTCRVVVTVELPWNPNRIEQRVGRVHRHGQVQRCHALHLIGRDTDEQNLATRMASGVGRIRRALGDGGTHLDDLAGAFGPARGVEHQAGRMQRAGLIHPDLRSEARHLAAVLAGIRDCRRPRRPPWPRRCRHAAAPVATCIAWRKQTAWPAAPTPGPGVILIHRLRVCSAAGSVLTASLTALHLDIPVLLSRVHLDTRDVRAQVECALEAARPRIDALLPALCERALQTARVGSDRIVSSDRRRIGAIRLAVQNHLASHLAQPGLFDDTGGRGRFAAPDAGIAWPASAEEPALCDARLELALVVTRSLPPEGARR